MTYYHSALKTSVHVASHPIASSMRSVVVALALCAAATVSAHPYTLCTDHDHMGTTNITLVPDMPLPGANFTTITEGTPDQTITGGSCKVTVKALGITVKSQTYDLCDIHACPIEANKVSTSTISAALSAATPHGVTCTTKVETLDSAGNLLSCVQMKLTIG